MTSTTTFEKTIRYDRETRDYRAELDGQLIGFYPNYHAAEVALDQVAYDLLADEQVITADQAAQADATVELATISEPVPTTGRRDDATYYLVTVSYRLMPLAYRLHNEQEYGIDGRGAFADSAPMWCGTCMASLDLPTAALNELRSLWRSLFVSTADAAPVCPICNDEGRVPNGSDCGELAGGWADPCECVEVKACEARDCQAPATHVITTTDPATHTCCFHYSEEFTGVLCPCRAVTVAAAPHQPSCPGTGLADCGKPVAKPGDFCQRCKDVLDRVFFETLDDPPSDDPNGGGQPWPDSLQAGQQAFKRITRELSIPARFHVTLRPEPVRVVRECPICGGDHHVQRCPRIWLELRRPAEVFYEAAA
jgi:hypothetical protein